MEQLPWKKIHEHLAYNGYRKILRKKFRLPNDTEEDYDILTQNDPVCVLALTQTHRVILARQFRPGLEKFFDELPSGLLENNETPFAGAERELLEETGYKGNLTFVRKFPEWAYGNSYIHSFIAHDCVKVQEPCTDEGEFITVVIKSLADFITQVRQGELTNTDAAYRSLDYLNQLKL